MEGKQWKCGGGGIIAAERPQGASSNIIRI